VIRAALLLAMLALVCVAAVARAQGVPPAAPDSLGDFLKGLADSTDASYGTQSVAIDTSGLDSLALFALDRPPLASRRNGGGLGLHPVIGFHRAEGWILGGGVRVGSRALGRLDMRGAYAFSSELGRYEFDYRRVLFESGGTFRRRYIELRRIADGGTRLDLELRYARMDLAFMAEHADPDFGMIGSIISGDNSQSIYEQRGLSAGLALWTGDWRFRAGVRDAKDVPLPRATTWSMFGTDGGVPLNALATPDDYTEPYGGIAFWRSDWEFGGAIDARGGGADRWRLRVALARATRLGSTIKMLTQVEAGAAPFAAPSQRRFEVGGAKAIPSLRYGVGSTNHLLLGTFELLDSHDVLRGLGLPHPEWLVLQPAVFAQAGTAWDDQRDVVFAMPPSASWRGTVGGGFVFRLGVPDPDSFWRLYMSWPVGPNSGVARFNFTAGTAFSLPGRL